MDRVTNSQRPDRPPVSIVVVTFNSEQTLEDCLASVLRTTRSDDEIVIVDNASADGTIATAERLAQARQQVEIIRNASNLGYSKAANMGIAATTRELIVLLNPDTEVYSGWVERMAWRAMAPDVGAVGPTSNVVSGEQFVNFHLPPSKHRGLSHQQLRKVIERYNDGLSMDTKLLVGFCLMTRRSILDRLGRLDEDLVLGSDDLELSWRLRINGYRLVMARDTYVRHVGQASFRTIDSVTSALPAHSAQLLRMKLREHYAPDAVPSAEEIWGVPFF